MDIRSLYLQLQLSYTPDNLQKITRKIIALYNNNQHAALQKILHTATEQPADPSSKQNTSFYKLMMMYHPDRLNFYLSEIEKHYQAKNLEELQKFSHIFSTLELEQTLVVLKSKQADEAPYQDLWESYVENFDEYNETEFIEEEPEEFLDEFEEMEPRNSFFKVFKKQMYGNSGIELPFYYLEDIDTLDLSGCGIDDLDGIQYCRQLTMVDLSNNRIPDVSDLAQLSLLHEVYLAGNRIGYIDALAFLHNLRVVDLSNNNINDLSPLFQLEQLEYVNVIGNRIPTKQLNTLSKKGVMVID